MPVNRTGKLRQYAVLALLLGALGAGLAQAHREPLALVAWTVDAGGGSSGGGRFRVDATIGQPAAGILSGGTFQLQAGFWHEQPSGPLSSVYLPLLQR